MNKHLALCVIAPGEVDSVHLLTEDEFEDRHNRANNATDGNVFYVWATITNLYNLGLLRELPPSQVATVDLDRFRRKADAAGHIIVQIAKLPIPADGSPVCLGALPAGVLYDLYADDNFMYFEMDADTMDHFQQPDPEDWLINDINLSQIGRECLYFFPAVTEELVQRGVNPGDAQAYARFIRRHPIWTTDKVTLELTAHQRSRLHHAGQE